MIIDKEKLSPMMRHYVDLKDEYKDCLLMYRLGDFYEMFFDDALIGSRILEITLTGRDCGLDERAPMCGVPYHALDSYAQKLVEAGYNVAICEQLSVPEKGKKLVDRDIVRVITPGTLIGGEITDNKSNNYIASIYKEKDNIGVAICDVSTGEFAVSEFVGDSVLSKLDDFLIMKQPTEIICNSELINYENDIMTIKGQYVPNLKRYNDLNYDYKDCKDKILNHFNISSLKDCGCANKTYAVSAGGALLTYLEDTQKRSIVQVNMLTYCSFEKYMQLDSSTRRNLELLENSKERTRKGSILWLLDKTNTVIGSRLLKQLISQPLQSEKEINLRLDAVDSLIRNILAREDLKIYLNQMYDLERLCTKAGFGNIMPKECLNLGNSLAYVPKIKQTLTKLNNPLINTLTDDMYDCAELVEELKKAINDSVGQDQNASDIIKKGYDAKLDELIELSTNSKKLLGEIEAREKQNTGIKNLKLKYNRVFGYYLEVLNTQRDLVPPTYIRRQTIANAERYVTDELKDIEFKILNSQQDKEKLQQELYDKIVHKIIDNLPQIQKTAKSIAMIDCLLSFATVSTENNYVKPQITKNNKILDIKSGRHPIIEKISKDQFIPNDVYLNNTDSRTMIITGPNMAGKSTYMRMTAIITLLAHIGCFVPCDSAKIPIVDRIFTRVGASDDLAFGQSTFMVEMSEVSNILKCATDDSLIILDEVGRGTSTFDGLSIAWSVIEYISKHINAKTLFSTHYHELISLEGILDGVKNYKVAVKEYNNSIIFLRKIQRGGTNQSFGIEVASLAGLPEAVLTRAKEILHILENNAINVENVLSSKEEVQKNENKTKNMQQVCAILSDLNINTLTPLSAFDILVQLKNCIEK